MTKITPMSDPGNPTAERGVDSRGAACPFAVSQLERACAPLFENQPLRILKVLSGNINTIMQVAVGGQLYGLRVRTQEQVYRYEPDLIKEVFVAWLLDHAGKAKSDAAVAAAFAQIRAAQRGLLERRTQVLPTLLYYDWSRQHLRHPYCVYQWVAGVPLWNTPEERVYALAGQSLARIHAVQFSGFYTDFLSIGHTPVSWAQRYRAALAKEAEAARPHLSGKLRDALGTCEIPERVFCTPCLVHNDFAPGNILVHGDTIVAVIDWDNAVIDAPHLDFVKMKYWTAKDVRGELRHDPQLFGAFVDGYGTAGRAIVSSTLFALYEVLWLLRVFNFEISKQQQGIARTPGYPAATVYTMFLDEALSRLTPIH